MPLALLLDGADLLLGGLALTAFLMGGPLVLAAGLGRLVLGRTAGFGSYSTIWLTGSCGMALAWSAYPGGGDILSTLYLPTLLGALLGTFLCWCVASARNARG